MLLEVFDVLFHREVHIVHDRGVALAHEAVQVQMLGESLYPLEIGVKLNHIPRKDIH